MATISSIIRVHIIIREGVLMPNISMLLELVSDSFADGGHFDQNEFSVSVSVSLKLVRNSNACLLKREF
jgi:hypothetical protein